MKSFFLLLQFVAAHFDFTGYKSTFGLDYIQLSENYNNLFLKNFIALKIILWMTIGIRYSKTVI